MLSAYSNWKQIEPELSQQEYENIEKKLRHIDTYIHDYAGSAHFTEDDVFDNLELDITTSYVGMADMIDGLSPWLLHASLTAEISPRKITIPTKELLFRLTSPTKITPLTECIREMANVLEAILRVLGAETRQSDALVLLFSVDVALTRIMDIICRARLARFVGTAA